MDLLGIEAFRGEKLSRQFCDETLFRKIFSDNDDRFGSSRNAQGDENNENAQQMPRNNF
ncbi:hypothetical protein BGCPKDLD_2635 [Methylorubrum suomiense]|uniref:Transposase n=1 Tax=Methylorubrum suomiense TaxID=144191 RepID=A0ABQ4UXA4_9HYPH|nr:hypothetical protein BGCPKDLD_2635 [Methylorubrum suomiense]